MGDGQHGWAAAEWVMMMRNLFVREEGDSLIIGSGILKDWLVEGSPPISFGPTLTSWGRIEVQLERRKGDLYASWTAEWRETPAKINVAVPGFQSRQFSGERDGRQTVVLEESE